jgi:hypothetical protein
VWGWRTPGVAVSAGVAHCWDGALGWGAEFAFWRRRTARVIACVFEEACLELCLIHGSVKYMAACLNLLRTLMLHCPIPSASHMHDSHHAILRFAIVVSVTVQDSASPRLLPDSSSFSCCIQSVASPPTKAAPKTFFFGHLKRCNG